MTMAHKMWPFILVSTCTLLVVSSLPTQHRIQTRSSMKLCGRMLVEALALVCQHQYYSPSYKRNNVLGDLPSDSWLYPTLESNTKKDGFLDSQSALSFLLKRDPFLRRTRGVSDECCKKSCTFSELNSYCYRSSRSLPDNDPDYEMK